MLKDIISIFIIHSLVDENLCGYGGQIYSKLHIHPYIMHPGSEMISYLVHTLLVPGTHLYSLKNWTSIPSLILHQ
jgi:hypothetical protein